MIRLLTALLLIVSSASIAGAYDFTLPPSSASLDRKFTVGLEGTGTNRVESIHFEKNVGTITMDGLSLHSFIQEAIPWEPLTLYQGIAFNEHHLQVFWVYCDKNQNMSGIYFEGLTGPNANDGPMPYEKTIGKCAPFQTAHSVLVPLPRIALAGVPVVSGFNIQGNNVRLVSGKLGQLIHPDLQFIPFATVDCTKCGNDGWYELHSLFFDSERKNFAFGIIYLMSDHTVRIGHSISLGDYSDPFERLDFTETWN